MILAHADPMAANNKQPSSRRRLELSIAHSVHGELSSSAAAGANRRLIRSGMQPLAMVQAELPHRDALVRLTCGGCHAKTPSGFHVDPMRRDAGGAVLSDFLRGEIARRRAFMQLTLASG
jgi:hypothetical protein